MDNNTFPTVASVVRFLHEQGVSVPRSTVFHHAKQGTLLKQKDGSFSLDSVLAYARQFVKEDTGNEDLAELQIQKLREEIRKTRALAERHELATERERGRLFDRQTVHREFAARIALLRSDYRIFVQEGSIRLQETFGIAPERVPELRSFLDTEGEAWITRYSEPTTFWAKIEASDDH